MLSTGCSKCTHKARNPTKNAFHLSIVATPRFLCCAFSSRPFSMLWHLAFASATFSVWNWLFVRCLCASLSCSELYIIWVTCCYNIINISVKQMLKEYVDQMLTRLEKASILLSLLILSSLLVLCYFETSSLYYYNNWYAHKDMFDLLTCFDTSRDFLCNVIEIKSVYVS